MTRSNSRLAPPDHRSEEPTSPSRNRRARLGFLRLNSAPVIGVESIAAMTSPQTLVKNTDEIRSTLYEWNCRHFAQPMLFLAQDDETAPEFCERKWQFQQNMEVVKEAQKLRDPKRVISSLHNEIAILENNTQMISQLCFHPFEDILLVSDEHDGIKYLYSPLNTNSLSVWDWHTGSKLNNIRNQNPLGSRITSLTLLNEHDSGLVSAGSDDGVVRIWGGIRDSSKTKLVTAWRVLVCTPSLSLFSPYLGRLGSCKRLSPGVGAWMAKEERIPHGLWKCWYSQTLGYQ